MSSPRVRGAGWCRSCVGRSGSVIPACAGSRGSIPHLKLKTLGHPRVCGEQGHRRVVAGYDQVSSPRVRGADRRYAVSGDHQPVIPACAGSRRPAHTDRSHSSTVIPACAGSRLASTRRRPRSSGMSHRWPLQASQHAEAPPPDPSSPRVRGADHPGRSCPTSPRVIPACAGNSGSRRGNAGPPAGHPCVCGEQRAATWPPLGRISWPPTGRARPSVRRDSASSR